MLNTRLSAKDYDTDKALSAFLYVFSHELAHAMDPKRGANAASGPKSEIRRHAELRANICAMQVTHAYLADMDDNWKDDYEYVVRFCQKSPVLSFVLQDFTVREQPFVVSMMADWLPEMRVALQAFKAARQPPRRRRR